jgi:hypothetical protein
MIRLIFGNVGSGKTSMVVREMKNNPHKKYITNIDVKGKGFEHVMKLKAEMILKKEVLGYKKNGSEIKKLSLNTEFWQNLIEKEGSVNIIIDEAHTILNARRGMSQINIIMGDWLALLRRVVGSVDGTGELTLISQLQRRLDVVSKEMAVDVLYARMHYVKVCPYCQFAFNECNETPLKREYCPVCMSAGLKKTNMKVEVLHFVNNDAFINYFHGGAKSYYRRYYITDIEKIFVNYNTLQFNDLLSNYY